MPALVSASRSPKPRARTPASAEPPRSTCARPALPHLRSPPHRALPRSCVAHASPLPPSSPRAPRPAAPEPSRPAFAHACARACARVGPPARHQLPAEPTPACSKQREGGGERIRERKCDCQ
ncbi:predicted GPI-anchored protein 58 [Panicum hallii]|uniref:predicted GPI-anchored protein 58 n=1 Tax=Panicum hallii TaxID=206008 RepID=UPI000DF4E2E0|nr:predicted GPI-anchored protein 58 [Panicum hallii]